MEQQIVSKEIFAQRFSEVLGSSSETTYTLGEKLSLSSGTISRYANGLMAPKIPTVYMMADIFGVNPLWLMGYDVPKYKNNDTPSPLSNVIPLPRTYKVPLVGTIACGQPILAVEEADKTVDVPEQVHADFALTCKGDSMINARIFDGDIVYIHSQPEVENGQIAAVRIGDEATLKKVYYTPGSDRITLRACNPLYPDMVYEGETLNQIQVLGLAVGFYSTIRHEQ